MGDDGPKWWDAAWPTKAEQREILRAARHRVAGRGELNKTPKGEELRQAERIRQLKARNADGMRRPPQSEVEWKAHVDFRIGRGGVNSMGMDLGDIAIALANVGDETKTAGEELNSAMEELDKVIAAVTAAKQRAEQAHGTFQALVGGTTPSEMAGAESALAGAEQELDPVLTVLNAAKDDGEEHAKVLLNGAEEISEYATALLA